MSLKNGIAVIFFLVFTPWKICATAKNGENGEIKAVLKELDDLLQSNVDRNNGLFDGIGSIDVAVYKKLPIKDAKITPVYLKSFGKAQVRSVVEKLSTLQGIAPSDDLKRIAKNFLQTPNVQALNKAEKRNQYRIASNTKTFIGVAANLMTQNHGLDLDEKIHPRYVNLSTLGSAHTWDNPTIQSGYPTEFPAASVYAKTITFRHLLSHTSGLSRESKKYGVYGYGSSRTSTERCPPNDVYQRNISCNQQRDNNWRSWTQHVVSYMMPNCGYANYNEVSNTRNSCLPGEYFHYSNAGYSILGLALDNYLKLLNSSNTLEDWIAINIFHPFNMTDTVFTWVDYNQEHKQRTVQGCQGGKVLESCNLTRSLTDYSDRGIKTPPGGIWSTTTDLVKYLLNLESVAQQNSSTVGIFALDPTFSPAFDDHSEEDSTQMPPSVFKYGHGWYIAEQFSCLPGQFNHQFQGAWGTVPGFTSYMITNREAGATQYAVVMLRSYNYAGRFNLGNQARRLLWRLLHPKVAVDKAECPVSVLDSFSTGDKVIILTDGKPSSALRLNANTVLLLSLFLRLLF